MDGHHLVLGELIDYLSGDVLPDTHDERYRQKIARLLIEPLGYEKSEIIARRQLVVSAGDKNAKIIIDFSVFSGDKIGMLIKYGPGSLTTRHTPALAAARLVARYQVPIVVVTNGEDAEILDTVSEKVIARGFDQLPNRDRLAEIISGYVFMPVSKKKMEMAARIVYCYEIDGACPCDTTVCRLEDDQPDTRLRVD
jgi:hypothetical protein